MNMGAGMQPKKMRLTSKQREDVLSMFNGHCAYCGTKLTSVWHADHVEPVYRKTKMVRGEDFRYRYVQTGECFNPENDRIGNLMPSCRPCNIDKGVYGLEDWRKSLENKPRVLRDNYSAWRHAERFGLVAQIEVKVVFYFEKTTPKSQASDVAAKLCDHGKDRSKQFCEECRLDEDGEAEMPGGFNV